MTFNGKLCLEILVIGYISWYITLYVLFPEPHEYFMLACLPEYTWGASLCCLHHTRIFFCHVCQSTLWVHQLGIGIDYRKLKS